MYTKKLAVTQSSTYHLYYYSLTLLNSIIGNSSSLLEVKSLCNKKKRLLMPTIDTQVEHDWVKPYKKSACQQFWWGVAWTITFVTTISFMTRNLQSVFASLEPTVSVCIKLAQRTSKHLRSGSNGIVVSSLLSHTSYCTANYTNQF